MSQTKEKSNRQCIFTTEIWGNYTNAIKGTSFSSQGYIHQLFPCNDNRGHESPRNSVLSRNGEVGIGEVAFGFVYSSNFFS